jgi:hypothetical protein
MARGDVRAVCGNPSTSFMKTRSSTTETDAFDDLGVHAYFDDDDRLNYVELHSFGVVEPVYRDIRLSGMWETVCDQLRSLEIPVS